MTGSDGWLTAVRRSSAHGLALARLNALLPDDVPTELRAVTYRHADDGWQVFWVVEGAPGPALRSVLERARRQCEQECASVSLSVVRVPPGAGRIPVVGIRLLYSRSSARQA
ncbi:hypothetical protein [Nocardioides aequoreus]|uniref:hypothetical protein n=1 Tax=Nocardioides aequoreus TaxID=397278 RepID=UPI0004C309BA|nr:hypothetical protein [Nocardioides aequoreus]